MKFRWSQDILRIICYVSGGISFIVFNGILGFVFLLIGIFLGLLIENIDEFRNKGVKA